MGHATGPRRVTVVSASLLLLLLLVMVGPLMRQTAVQLATVQPEKLSFSELQPQALTFQGTFAAA